MTEKRTNEKKPFPRRDAKPGARPFNKDGKKPFGKKPFGKPAGNRPAGAKPAADRVFGRSAKDAPQETTGLTMNARRVALDVLCDVHQKGAYASLALDEHLRAAKLRPEDRRLVTSIVYGTLENELKIDFALDKLMDHPTHQASQRDILRMSAYQILFLDRVPDSAAVNEAVKLVKAMGMEAASGFVNAVLRNLSRGKNDIEWPKKEDDLRVYLSVMGSYPMWLVDRLIADYGEE